MIMSMSTANGLAINVHVVILAMKILQNLRICTYIIRNSCRASV